MFGRNKPPEDPAANACASGLSQVLSDAPGLGNMYPAAYKQLLMDQHRRAYEAALLPKMDPRYARFTLHVEECENGYLVELAGKRHYVADLTKLGELAITYVATMALEKD